MPFQKAVQKSLSQHKIMRKLRSYEEKGLLMQYHSINIEKIQKRMKNKFSDIAYQIRWSVGDDFKIIISTKSNAVESNHSDDSDITKRSKLQCLPLGCFSSETLLCCQEVHGQRGKCHFKPCYALKYHPK